jgi:hypothetical protein
MVYQHLEYQVRASLGRNEWVILIYYPDNAGGKSTNSKFTGTKEEAVGAARHKIDNWLKEQKRKAPSATPRRVGRPPGSKNRT